MASKLEKIFADFLTNNNIKYVSQKTVNNCPFNRGGKYKIDFYLPDYDLYIEVKGQMTMYQVNVLRYCSEYLGKNYYILQMTSEDWIGPYSCSGLKNIRSKIMQDTATQFNEILDLSQNRITTDELCKRSKIRLEKYIAYRNGDISRWI